MNLSPKAPWLQAIVRFLEIMLFAGLAGGVDWLITYFQTSHGGFSPLFISIVVAGLASAAKYAREMVAQTIAEDKIKDGEPEAPVVDNTIPSGEAPVVDNTIPSKEDAGD